MTSGCLSGGLNEFGALKCKYICFEVSDILISVKPMPQSSCKLQFSRVLYCFFGEIVDLFRIVFPHYLNLCYLILHQHLLLRP